MTTPDSFTTAAERAAFDAGRAAAYTEMNALLDDPASRVRTALGAAFGEVYAAGVQTGRGLAVLPPWRDLMFWLLVGLSAGAALQSIVSGLLA